MILFLCPECGCRHSTKDAALRCAEQDRKVRR